MNCDETRSLLDAYVDSELDLVTSLRVEEHLCGCAECRQVLEQHRLLHTMLQAEPPRFALPAGLERRVVAAIQQSENNKVTSSQPPVLSMLWLRRTSLAACLLLLGGIVGGIVARQPHGENSVLTDELVSGHVRSLQARHIFDVASTSQHTVKPWFAGNLDFSPPVLNLTDQGFPLMGGRLDYLTGRPVAALVYRRHQHWINLFVWPTSEGKMPLEQRSDRGYSVCRWSADGMAYAAVSDLNNAEMQDFVQLEQKGNNQLPTIPPPSAANRDPDRVPR